MYQLLLISPVGNNELKKYEMLFLNISTREKYSKIEVLLMKK